jgi:pyruvate,orthophosphate dikinase
MTDSNDNIKRVYYFGPKGAEGSADRKQLLGGKGANLAEMANQGLPVPPGFTLTTETCVEYLRSGCRMPGGLREEVEQALARLEEEMETRFGDPENPLLLSVRSGAAFSMPGMMDTVLNLGLNARSVEGLATRSGNRRFALDCRRRLIQMYGDVVLELSKEPFEKELQRLKDERGVKADTELTAGDLAGLVETYLTIIHEGSGKPFPEEPLEQLWGGIEAVFRSWDNPRARTYRKLNHLPDDLGTAVNVQAMVYGNLGEDCATGVAFTRDPATGENRFFGEYLQNAQGEDVVAGIRTPRPLAKESEEDPEKLPSLERIMEGTYAELVDVRDKLEKHYGDMQDLEFTIQSGRLYILQTRTGQRTGVAAVRMAWEMVRDGLIDETEAVRRVDPAATVHLLSPVFQGKEKDAAIRSGRLLGKGLPAGPGAATGKLVFDADTAVAWAGKGEKVVLARAETSPEDVGGMAAAAGILTSRGGLTSHAAVVARGMGKPCVVGAEEIRVDVDERVLSSAGRTLREGEWISIDGTTGEVLQGRLQTEPSDVVAGLLHGDEAAREKPLYRAFSDLMSWADDRRRLGVRTNADTPEQAAMARTFGAGGIGLCRTEHMFFGEGRILPFREMIMARDEASRRAALDKLLPIQREDFAGIFRAMAGCPVTIRLLDPPLHEFLPRERAEQEELARALGVPPVAIHEALREMWESNPMLGHRGCRLLISYPEIAEMQTRAILEAAAQVAEEGHEVLPEIMVPLVGTPRELGYLDDVIRRTAVEVLGEEPKVPYLVGTMIEVPRAALAAGGIAEVAEFFSFGTNDLTQMTYGFSRDDIGKFLPTYLERRVLAYDPFQSVDEEGVGELVRTGTERGRAARPELKVGVCGEHGGDPASIRIFHAAGLDYVSCSPFRVPVARLAAAQAALEEMGVKAGSGTA